MKELNRKLWFRFSIACAPFFILLLAAYLIHRGDSSTLLPSGLLRPFGLTLFILSVVLDVGLPIILRTRFHDAIVKSGHPVTIEEYLVYQKRLMAGVGMGGALAGLAYLLVVPNLMLYGSVLAALYGIYSILPFIEKVSGELKSYGYKPESVDQEGA